MILLDTFAHFYIYSGFIKKTLGTNVCNERTMDNTVSDDSLLATTKTAAQQLFY